MPIHNIEPIYDKNSNILILGSFPSVKSREIKFYYGHPQNRFWKVISTIFNEEYPKDINSKKSILLRNNIALWDVIKSCDIKGSSDTSIENVIPNDISLILNNSNIETIYCNGNKSYELYMRYIYPNIKIEPVKLPSTSPANAACTLEKLIETWKQIKR